MRSENIKSKLQIGAGLALLIATFGVLAMLPSQPTSEKVCGKYYNADHYCYTVERRPL